jgi:hypothetical protein
MKIYEDLMPSTELQRVYIYFHPNQVVWVLEILEQKWTKNLQLWNVYPLWNLNELDIFWIILAPNKTSFCSQTVLTWKQMWCFENHHKSEPYSERQGPREMQTGLRRDEFPGMFLAVLGNLLSLIFTNITVSCVTSTVPLSHQYLLAAATSHQFVHLIVRPAPPFPHSNMKWGKGSLWIHTLTMELQHAFPQVSAPREQSHRSHCHPGSR